jgi:DNA-binding PadR family transcriptional regulator
MTRQYESDQRATINALLQLARPINSVYLRALGLNLQRSCAALRRLEDQGILASDWGPRTRPRLRTYSLTNAGADILMSGGLQ